MAPDASGAGPLASEVATAGYEILGPFLCSEDAMQAMSAGPPHAAVLGGAPAAHLSIAQELRQRGIPLIVYSDAARGPDTHPLYRSVPWLAAPSGRSDLIAALGHLRTLVAG
jgi:hypothetical protein